MPCHSDRQLGVVSHHFILWNSFIWVREEIYNLIPKFHMRHEGLSNYGPRTSDTDLIYNFCWPISQSPNRVGFPQDAHNLGLGLLQIRLHQAQKWRKIFPGSPDPFEINSKSSNRSDGFFQETNLYYSLSSQECDGQSAMDIHAECFNEQMVKML